VRYVTFVRLVRILQTGLDARVLSISRLSACVGYLAAAKINFVSTLNSEYVSSSNLEREHPCCVFNALCQIPRDQVHTNAEERDQGSSLRSEVVMRTEVDEQQAGSRILRRAAHARI
jgi:hypothetical protein